MYLKDENKIWIATGGGGKEPVYMLPKMMSRHGLVTGATGTGKTTTIKVMAEAFSDMGVPVFMADIKGDVSGLCKPGDPQDWIEEKIKTMGIQGFTYGGYPVCFFDVYGKEGIPVRTTVSGMGPVLFARILGLNETQAGVLQIIFRIADDSGLLLLDFKDLRAMVQYAGEHAKEFTTKYGNITTASVGAIQRALLTLEEAGGDFFFGEPALDMRDWLAWDSDGRGVINILNCVTLFQNPLLYSTFLLWMLSELYEIMPEVGDPDKPKVVFFFDEAHLLFNDAPKALLDKVEQVIRLIRSKGVGIYFISQSPADIPDSVLSQLGNKIQHALRAYTPNDQKAVRAAAASFRPNPAFDSETVIGELSTGEALVSALDEKGAPQMVQRGFITPPRCNFGVAEPELVSKLIQESPLSAKYSTVIDRASAFETLEQTEKQEQMQKEQEAAAAQLQKEQQQQQKAAARPQPQSRSSKAVDRAVSSAMSQIGRSVGRELIRGLLGSLRR